MARRTATRTAKPTARDAAAALRIVQDRLGADDLDGVTTLAMRNRDSLDFRSVSVADLEAIVMAAIKYGRETAK